MKVCLAGKNNIAVNILKELIKKIPKKNILIIVNKNDLNEDNWQRSLYKYAKKELLTITQLQDVYDIENLIFLSAEFDKIINIEKFKKNSSLYNIHFSKLPKYKGMYTSAHPILNNEKETGVTLHKIDNGIDTGDIIDQETFEISPSDTARSLYLKYIEYGTKLVLKNLDAILNNKTVSIPQKVEDSSYYSKLSINYRNLTIDLNQTAENIYNQLRAFNFREYQLPKVNGVSIISSKITKIKSVMRPGCVIFEDELAILLTTIDYNIIVYKDRSKELFEACAKGEYEVIKQICCVKEHLDIQNEKGWSPLVIATYNGHIEIVKFLVGQGADIRITNNNNTNLLMYSKDFYKKSKNRYLYDLYLKLGIKKEDKDYCDKSLVDYLNEEKIDLD